jgi:hypothetical protein
MRILLIIMPDHGLEVQAVDGSYSPAWDRAAIAIDVDDGRVMLNPGLTESGKFSLARRILFYTGWNRIQG